MRNRHPTAGAELSRTAGEAGSWTECVPASARPPLGFESPVHAGPVSRSTPELIEAAVASTIVLEYLFALTMFVTCMRAAENLRARQNRERSSGRGAEGQEVGAHGSAVGDDEGVRPAPVRADLLVEQRLVGAHRDPVDFVICAGHVLLSRTVLLKQTSGMSKVQRRDAAAGAQEHITPAAFPSVNAMPYWGR